MKIYISGPITGAKGYMEKFASAERALTQEGHTVINPAKVNAGLPKTTTHAEYMATSIVMLDMCDMIFMLEGWQQSAGCAEELIHAARKGITITFEGGRGCQKSKQGQGSLPQKQGKKSKSVTGESASSAGSATTQKEPHGATKKQKASCTIPPARTTVLGYLRTRR